MIHKKLPFKPRVYFFTIQLLICFFIFFQSNNIFAQSIQRETIASSGNYIYLNNFLLKETVGQSYHTKSFYNNDFSFRPGFQQPEKVISIRETNVVLSLYPNPTYEYLNIKASESMYNVTIHIIDATGIVLLTEKLDELSTYNLNVTGLIDGFYIITFTTSSSRTVSSKFVISNP